MGIQPIVRVLSAEQRSARPHWIKEDVKKARLTHQDGPNFARMLADATLALAKDPGSITGLLGAQKQRIS